MMPVYLKTEREKRGWTQVQLAARSGVAQNTISKLERNEKTRPGFPIVVALAMALAIDPARLRFGQNPRQHPRRKNTTDPAATMTP